MIAVWIALAWATPDRVNAIFGDVGDATYSWDLERNTTQVEVACNIPVTFERREPPVEPTGPWVLPACEPTAIAEAFRVRFGSGCTYVAEVEGDRVHVGPATIDGSGTCVAAQTRLDVAYGALVGRQYLMEQQKLLAQSGIHVLWSGLPEYRTNLQDPSTARDLLDSLLIEEPDGRRTTWKIRRQLFRGEDRLEVTVTHVGGPYMFDPGEGPYHYSTRWWDTDGPRFQENTPEEEAELEDLNRALRAGEITVGAWRERRATLLARTRLRVGETYEGQAEIERWDCTP